MDPLSVLASVVGILAAATKIASALSGVKSSLADAPQSIDHALSQVNGIKVALSAIEKLLHDTGGTVAGHVGMIHVDDLVVTLTEAVLTFDKLEDLVSPFSGWAWKEDQVESILVRLERHKSTLLLMLSIAQSRSNVEAEQSRVALQRLVQQVLESNTDIARRLRSLEDMAESQNAHFSIHRATVGNLSAGTSEFAFQHSFEADLSTTRVYNRTQLYNSDVSFTSSAVRTHVWSVFSGLSLSKISNISVIALPVYQHEL
ncbi:hypothetical protein DL98DRAFT_641691, partial [Cadophora sp. DSE1049]